MFLIQLTEFDNRHVFYNLEKFISFIENEIFTDRKGKVMFSQVLASHSYWFTTHPCYGPVGMHPTGMLSCYRLQRSWAKVMFLQASVILSTGGEGVCLSECWDTTPLEQTPPRADTPTPTPPQDQPPQCRHPPRADTPHPPGPAPPSTDTSPPPLEQTPPGTRHPPGKQTPAYGQ